MKMASQKKAEDINAFRAALADFSSLDRALLDAHSGDISREQFREMLQAASPEKSINYLEADVLFDALDQSRDGIIQPSEIRCWREPGVRYVARRSSWDSPDSSLEK
eukprot:TRINITY_DN28141_c0_g1_i3.p1 TRINITY_DN28141_c0_g1~~TRINITY_DN28141_c0_g1_i3.p1  ORF type:complete len:107 (-),score=23.12 TRINITY_DN28141_c0_g1_i3:143-463(-)